MMMILIVKEGLNERIGVGRGGAADGIKTIYIMSFVCIITPSNFMYFCKLLHSFIQQIYVYCSVKYPLI